MRFGPWEILERRDLEGDGFDARARDDSGSEVRLWAGRQESGLGAGKAALDERRALLATLHDASLPRVVDAAVVESRAVLVMAAYRGDLLSERLGSAPLEPPAALDVARAIGAALAKAHGRGLFHGAVGSSEILLETGGRPLLLHLGLGPFLGARGARAPEDDTPAAADVFGLARVLFECLTGRDPFAAGVFRDPGRPEPDELGEELPEGLRRFLARALRAEPRSRIRRADELSLDLAVIRASWGQDGRSDPRRRKLGRSVAVWVGLAAVLALGLASIRDCAS